MGDISALESIDRVLEAHGDELIEEVRENLPSELKQMEGLLIELYNDVYHISVILRFPSGGYLALCPYDIDYLAEIFPDCDVGY